MDSMQEEADTGQQTPADSRYYCPYPNCKRSFAELWRLKVHYRAPPDIRGSGKERGHGTELTHCPKCGKGLKPGKHHVGCSGGKAGPRQNKKSRLAGAAAAGAAMDGMSTGMYTLQMQYGQAAAAGMPNGLTQTQLQQAAGYQQQYLAQQYQAADMYGGQLASNMSSGIAQQQVQQQQQSPALSMGVLPDQLTNGAAALGASVQGISSTGATDAAGLISSAQAGYYQQAAIQHQMVDASGMVAMQSNLLQDSLAALGAHQQFGMSASAQYIQTHQQAPQQQQPDAGVYAAAVGAVDPAAAAAVAAPSTAGLMLPPQPVQIQGQVSQQQPQQQVAQMQFVPPGSTVVTSAMPQPSAQQQQQLLSPTAVPQQQLQPQLHLQQQQHSATPVLAPDSTSGLQTIAAGSGLPQQLLQPVMPPPIQTQVVEQHQQQPPQQTQQQQVPTPLRHQISSNMFDEIDGFGGMQAPPSPPPLPADFLSASGTLFNFAQFSQKLPAAAPPSQQMAMMPRGMEQELPPSLDELWTPEQTYDHHSDGDLMQLLFGAPEQPPTMATIHLHHFLDDDACSSPGLLAGILNDSMDNLQAAGAAAAAGAQGQAVKVEASSAMVAPPIPPQQPQLQPPPQQQQQQQQQQAFVPMGVKAEQQQQQQVHHHHQQQQQPQQHMMASAAMLPPQQQQQHMAAGIMPQQPLHMLHDQQHMYNTVTLPVNGHGVNGLNGYGCAAPGGNGLLPPNGHGQCGAAAAVQVHMSLQLNVQQQQELAAAAANGGAGLMTIKGEEDATLLMQQKAAVAAALPGAMASRAN